MKLENQVTSLELSKRLKELGVSQDSYFNWCSIGHETSGDRGIEILNQDKYEYYSDYDEVQVICSAYTVSELAEMLPKYMIIEQNGVKYSCDLQIIRSSVWRFYYGEPHYKEESIIYTALTGDSEADARARFLIYLLENKLI